MSKKGWAQLACVAGILVVVACLALPTVQVVSWVGGDNILVTIRSPRPLAIKSVTYVPGMNREQVEFVDDLMFKPAELSDNHSFIVRVMAMGTDYSPIFWKQSTFHQERFAAIRIELESGERISRIITLPDYRQSKSMTLDIP